MTSTTMPAPEFPAPRGWRGRLPRSHRVMLAIGALLTLVTISLLIAVGLVTRLAAGESRLNGRDVPFADYVGSLAGPGWPGGPSRRVTPRSPSPCRGRR